MRFPEMWYWSDQQSLRSAYAYASRLNILRVKLLSFLALKEAVQARLSLHLLKCHIVGNHMSWLSLDFFNKQLNKEACKSLRSNLIWATLFLNVEKALL